MTDASSDGEVPERAPHEFDGKVALVTGSSSGIGAATARSLATAGATVALNSSSSVSDGEALAAELPGATYHQADVGDEDAARQLVADVVAEHGRLDVVVNNAGVTEVIAHHDLEAATPAIWRRLYDVNVIGAWTVSVAAMDHLKATHGAIMNVASVAGLRPTGSSIPYAVSKAALIHMTQLLANVAGPEVRVNAVAPGLVDTPWTEDWHDIRKAVQERTPLRRSGQPEDVAKVILTLLAAGYVTGETVAVDGGLRLR